VLTRQRLHVTGLVCRQKSEVVGRVRDDVTFGVRVERDRTRQIAEPIDSDAENSELTQSVDEQLAVRTAHL